MGETILTAVERNMKPKQCRENGFTPGALYSAGVTNSISVQFETAALRRVLAAHGPNAKIWVEYGNDKKFGIIKEVQRDPVSAKVTHIDVNLISQEHEVKMQIPIVFEGRNDLNDALLQVHKSEIEVSGKANLMPDSVVIDVSTMAIGDVITSANFALDKQIRILDKEDEVYGIIAPQREAAEESETVTETATETKAQ